MKPLRCTTPGNSIIMHVDKTRNTCAIRRHRPESSFEILEREAAHARLVTMRRRCVFRIYRSSCWSDQSMSSFAGLSRSRKHSVSQFLVQLYSSRPNVRANFSHKLMGKLQNFQVCSNIILNGVREKLLCESENITQKYMHVNRKVYTHTLDSNRWL